MKIKHLFIILLSQLIISGGLQAQNKSITITGTVLESSGKQAVEFATVALKNKQTDELIIGATTQFDGTFEIETKARDFYIEISFIGFENTKLTDFETNKNVELGTIVLVAQNTILDEVTVRAEKSQTEFRLDKRVFNVGQDLNSTGASALEVLNNVPSVSVNIEGQVSLRGSTGVQMLIDGKPSILADNESNALGTITAEMIERVEVITNPSAKYEAEGTAGIINIVLKKEEKEGINGSLSVNTGYPHNHSVGISLNRRANKFNLFTQMGAGYRSLPRHREALNTNLTDNESIHSEGTEYRNEQFYNFILGTDYHINDNNVLTLSGNFAYEIEDQPSATDFRQLNATNDIISEWQRSEVTEAINPKWQYEIQYKSDFKDHKEHDFILSATGRFFGKEQSSEFTHIIAPTSSFSLSDQQTGTKFQEANYTFKADYTKPFAEKFALETGTQYVIQDVSNDFAVSDLIDDEWQLRPELTNVFDYDQKVFGVYGTISYEGKKWGIKTGLRLENTDLKTLLQNTNEANNLNYNSLFPSAHTSYKFSERFSLQAGYSRRIYRPRLWDLNPFFNIRNNFNIREGNPELLPEFTDSYEITGIYILEKITMNVGVYQRYTKDVIERISFFENNVNTTKPINIGTNLATGIEFNSKYTPNDWWTLNNDFNFNFFNRQGEFEQTNIDFNASRWSTRLNSKFKLPADFDIELTGNYESGYKTVQGKAHDMLFGDLGIRKKLMKGKAVFNFSVRDIFASRISVREIFQDNFYAYNRNFRGRFITLGFSYGFGKGEAMQYTGRRR